MPSFDIVSKVDPQEVDNAVNQAIKEISQRFDFKGSKSEIKWEKKEEITVIGDSDNRLKTVIDLLQGKFVKRGISLKSLEYGKVEDASGGLKRQVIKIIQGIQKEKAKEIAEVIKKSGLKVQAQIMDDQVRVTGKKIDDLQETIQILKTKDLGVSLQCVNMRD
ncbi:MAG TPA: YajQ family cyclic di-GMP-binding protein [Deltaproteobacteria bacterium]|nr:MAG: YajQ family cyclic di-GMP-binding protein [Deltaproteobacteria bacterium GWB2_42_7]OGP43903.1 MAG: YajQ family cyclic di-GMP-binding protein [Deltaproteobacteria bacterium GWD2_42_10]OGP46336.1 MAG: YajQ family cyclic di-GMP-binding protein [Deltaproteobacteria bacterium GWF2_42_12]OGQ75323.1 MAG: YajQ family cyclic di-GMP-binding protein [Deltaproteobacteria bacterium RIFOXYA2_FULL_42_10]HAG50324.1 YajQ family cyclic di-GMP-binding protein [Deltaproteobacteria bacterium]HLA03942.1 Yaj